MLIRLSPTGIEYGDYAWNFASGCGNNIDGKCKAGGFKCWAYSISQRFDSHFPNGFAPTIYPEALLSPLYLKKPSRILCAFMGDLFWDCSEFDPDKKIHSVMPSGKASISMSLKGWIFTTIKQCPQHTFLFLTKQPQNLIKFSPFPDNCWVGFTAIDNKMLQYGLAYIGEIEAKIKYVSFEPLLGQIVFPTAIDQLDWVIIGALTSKKHSELIPLHTSLGLDIEKYGNIWTLQPEIEWVQEIVEACDEAGIPVFIKDNLKAYASNLAIYPNMKVGDKGYDIVRQEMPNE